MIKGRRKKHWRLYPCLRKLPLVAHSKSLFQNTLTENPRKGVVTKSQGVFWVPGSERWTWSPLGLELESWKPARLSLVHHGSCFVLFCAFASSFILSLCSFLVVSVHMASPRFPRSHVTHSSNWSSLILCLRIPNSKLQEKIIQWAWELLLVSLSSSSSSQRGGREDRLAQPSWNLRKEQTDPRVAPLPSVETCTSNKVWGT